ncbi:MAG: NAD-dependent epimerase/dehydratase family protein [Burkholderia gladioli]
MSQTVFVAGASGVIGRVLVPLLVEAGYTVHGATRRAELAAQLTELGAQPVVVDVFDQAALARELARIAPDAVVHQLTDLPAGLDPARMAQAIADNARVRSEGTLNLVQATLAAGCRHMVAQSIAWAYAPGAQPYDEAHRLDLAADGTRRISVGGVAALEQAVLNTAPLRGAVLRYGRLYGPGTGASTPPAAPAVHVHAAARAALLALRTEATGAFNIVDDNGEVTNVKARQVLGWVPGTTD